MGISLSKIVGGRRVETPKVLLSKDVYGQCLPSQIGDLGSVVNFRAKHMPQKNLIHPVVAKWYNLLI